MGLIKDIPTCEELLNNIEQEAEGIIDHLSSLRSTSGAKL
jgi:hypothetical protein